VRIVIGVLRQNAPGSRALFGVAGTTTTTATTAGAAVSSGWIGGDPKPCRQRQVRRCASGSSCLRYVIHQSQRQGIFPIGEEEGHLSAKQKDNNPRRISLHTTDTSGSVAILQTRLNRMVVGMAKVSITFDKRA
jgi:hypothetical protein